MIGNKDVLRMRVQRLNFWLIIFTVTTTLGYGGFCVWQALNDSPATGQNMESVLPSNPRPMIALCWAAATITLLFLPEIGRVIAALCLGGVLYAFGSWLSATAWIKTNLGVERIAGADWLGNVMIGAEAVDLVVALVTLFVLALDTWVIYKKFVLRTGQNAASRLPPMVAHK